MPRKATTSKAQTNNTSGETKEVKKRVVKKAPETIEYVNSTKGVILYVDVTTPYDEKPVPQKVLPGDSVFLTPEDVRRNTHQSKNIFVLGHLRPASLGDEVLTKIEVRDAMAQIEIEEFVKRADEFELFERDVAKLNSQNTLDEVLDNCKRENKPWKFIECVMNRKTDIENEERGKVQLD